MKTLYLVLLAALLGLTGCSRFSTREGTAPILEPLNTPPPSTGSFGAKPIEQELAPPPAERAFDSPGVTLPADTALPVRKVY